MQYINQVQVKEFYKSYYKQSTLHRLDIELTERCNNSCIHCYINQRQDNEEIKSREMSTSFIKNIINEAALLGCLSLRFTGGEPLLRKDYQELYEYTRKKGIQVILFTNATLIDEDLCKLFERIPPGKPIEVTCYGIHNDSYDEIAGRHGAFIEFLNGINLLLKSKIPFIVKQSLFPQNINEITEFEAFAAELTSMKNKPEYSINFDLRTRKDYSEKNLMIKSLRFSPEKTLDFLTRDPDQYIKLMKQFAKKLMYPLGKKLFHCNAGSRSCSVDAYGNSQMCLLLRHPKTIYSLFPEDHFLKNPSSKMSPLEYALKVFFPIVRDLEAKNYDYLKRCAKCFLRNLCDQCPAKSWEEFGQLDVPVEYYCQVAHIQARFLGLLSNNEYAWQVENWRERVNKFIVT